MEILNIAYQVGILILALMLQTTMAVAQEQLTMRGFSVKGQQKNFVPCVFPLRSFLLLLLQLPFGLMSGASNTQWRSMLMRGHSLLYSAIGYFLLDILQCLSFLLYFPDHCQLHGLFAFLIKQLKSQISETLKLILCLVFNWKNLIIFCPQFQKLLLWFQKHQGSCFFHQLPYLFRLLLKSPFYIETNLIGTLKMP